MSQAPAFLRVRALKDAPPHPVSKRTARPSAKDTPGLNCARKPELRTHREPTTSRRAPGLRRKCTLVVATHVTRGAAAAGTCERTVSRLLRAARDRPSPRLSLVRPEGSRCGRKSSSQSLRYPFEPPNLESRGPSQRALALLRPEAPLSLGGRGF